MERSVVRRVSIVVAFGLFCIIQSAAQNNLKRVYTNSTVYAGIEIGSKGVKMSLIEVDKNAQSNPGYSVLKDSSINTDFISFSAPASAATLTSLSDLYALASTSYKIPSNRIFTVVSSGVKMQAEKEGKTKMLNELVTAFKSKINEPGRKVDIVDVREEARLSHLGIIPDSKRYTTFLIDIGSGNSKGGYFPYGNNRDFKLFQLNWGTKSVANATEKRCDENDRTLTNFNKQLFRVLSVAENTEIIYAVNESGSYPLTDNIVFSGGIAWSLATLMHPEYYDRPIVVVTFDEVKKFTEKILNEYASLSDTYFLNNLREPRLNRGAMAKEVKRVHNVFDQRSLLAGTSLMLKIMRQFTSLTETKQFYLVKNGQVGWVSAYVDQAVDK